MIAIAIVSPFSTVPVYPPATQLITRYHDAELGISVKDALIVVLIEVTTYPELVYQVENSLSLNEGKNIFSGLVSRRANISVINLLSSYR